jgi:23S rRNA G2445 N2-methylase RlmL
MLTTDPEPPNCRQCAMGDTSGVGLDISEECVACAVEMAESVGVQDRIGFVAADFCIPDDVSPTKVRQESGM